VGDEGEAAGRSRRGPEADDAVALRIIRAASRGGCTRRECSPACLLGADVPVGGTEQREAPAFSVHGVGPSRERDVPPSGPSFPDGEADQLEPAERAGVGFEGQFRVGQLPRGLPDVTGTTRTDTSSVLPLVMESSIGCRGPETDGVGESSGGSWGCRGTGWDARP
jgi:hypothetical protein